jgi:hypothetical protein
MQRVSRVAAIAATLLLSVSFSNAQQIDWKQTINLPKGLNMPQGVSADILGIQLGDTYEEASAKLEKIKAEANAPAESDKKIGKTERIIQLATPGGNLIKASYIGALRLDVDRMRGSPKGSETVQVFFSAPSSGYQVLGVKRVLTYSNQQEQIRISDLVAALKAKYKSEPQVYPAGGTTKYLFQFDNGRAFVPPNAKPWTCGIHISGSLDEVNVKRFNEYGFCDVILHVEVRTGISNDHAQAVTFWLADNERTKQNVLADYAFFNGYARQYQQRSGGAAPKL